MPILDLLNIDKVKEYEKFIETSDYGHFMQSIKWADVKKNWERDYVYIEDEDGNIKAAMSLLSISNDGESSFTYCSKGPVCDFNDPGIVKKLIREANPVLEKRNSFLLRMDPEFVKVENFDEMYENENIGDIRIYSSLKDINKFSNPFMRMIVKNKYDNFEDYISEFSSKMRNKIRKGYKSNIKVEKFYYNSEGFDEAFDEFYKLIIEVANRQKISHRPKEYFLDIFESFKDNAILYQFSHEEEILCSCIILNYNRKSMYIYSGSSNVKKNLYPSTFMLIETIKDSFENGYTEYDMGGIKKIDDSDGLYGFKRNFTRPKSTIEFATQIDLVLDLEKYNEFLKNS